jgi:hypothetical protein
MITTEQEWSALTDAERLARLRDVEMDRDNLRHFLRGLVQGERLTEEAQARALETFGDRAA